LLSVTCGLINVALGDYGNSTWGQTIQRCGQIGGPLGKLILAMALTP